MAFRQEMIDTFFFHQLLKSPCLFYVGRAGSGFYGVFSCILTYFFTVLNSEQFKVEWDYQPSAINAALFLGSRDTASVETASCGGVYVEQAREKGKDAGGYSQCNP